MAGLSSPSNGATPDRAPRLAAHADRVQAAEAVLTRPLEQTFWNVRRTTTEILRQAGRSILAPALPHSRFLEKKLSRPKPRPISYRQDHAEEKPLILHLLANFEIGGTPQLICDIIEDTQADYRHLVVSKHIPRPAPYSGVDLIDMPLPLAGRELEQLLQRTKPALVHVHYWNGMTEDFIWYHSVFSVLKTAGVPVVENVNTSGEPYFSDIVSKYVFCSEWSRRASGAGWLPETVIYPGTRLDDFYRADLDAVTDDQIGMVYRLHGDKIGPNAIEVFIEAMHSVPSARTVIVGDGALVDPFKARIAAEGLQSRTTFAGWVSYERLQEIYRDMSIFVAPVKDDTFGSVSVYAMCAGIPVVGFDVGGIPEIVGSPDLLAPPGDVARLAQIVADLLKDRSRRIQIGIENQRRARDMFSRAAMTRAFRELYTSLAANTESLRFA